MNEIYAAILEGLSSVANNIAHFEWELLFIWCLLMAIDIASGYIKACKHHKAASSLMRTGIYRKMLDTFSILAILLMQGVISYMGVTAPIGSILIGAFCFKEVSSILENTAKSNGVLPKPVRHWLDNVRNIVQLEENNVDKMKEIKKNDNESGDSAKIST
ncbi:MAG: phage holin family protein [Defluviitaleaceae bacterium]|nr:phage holin family protein [Defluviitaleaceae bacterium]